MEYLALTVLSKDQLGIGSEITKLIQNCDCNIADCHMLTLGSEYTANFLLYGSWNAIAKLEATLPTLEKKHELRCLWSRTTQPGKQIEILPYSVYVIAQNETGIIYQLTNFFSELAININDLSVEIYSARFLNIMMCAITMSVSIPINMPISDLREQFILFCERFNYDGIIEPEKS